MSSVYIHIPFCTNICSYCDFTKFYYNEKLVDEYLEALEEEINLRYKNEVIKTLYIGGGTPTSLNYYQLKKLFSITKKFKKADDFEFTIEANLDITINKIKLFHEYGINRVSLGVQTVNKKYLKFLNRKHAKDDIYRIMNDLKQFNITNISFDIIYAIPGQTIDELLEDLDFLTMFDITHISTYSLIIEDHTMLKINKIQNIDEDLDYKMYETINEYLKNNGFINYEISNYGKKNYFSKHNLVYWNNDNYYGFGLSSSGYINDVRYDNTKNITEYIKGNYIKNSFKLTLEETMENEMILGLRKINGVSKSKFYKKYKKNIDDVFYIKQLLEEGKIQDSNGYIKISEKYLYLSNEILINFIKIG